MTFLIQSKSKLLHPTSSSTKPTLLYLILFPRSCFASGNFVCCDCVFTSGHNLVVHLSLAKTGQTSRWFSLRKLLSVVVYQNKAIETFRGTPNKLKGDSRTKLNMRHVLGWVLVATNSAGRPRSSTAQLGKRCRADSGTELIADGNLFYASVVFVVRHVIPHASEIDMVVVVERMARVSLARTSIRKVSQSTRPQNFSADFVPRIVQVFVF